MQRLAQMEVAMHPLGIQSLGTQLIEAAQQTWDVWRQRRGDSGRLVQPVDHDHRRTRTQHPGGVKRGAESMVNLRKRPAQRLSLGGERKL